MHSSIPRSVSLVVAATCVLCSPVVAQHTHDHGDHSHAAVAASKSFTEAAQALSASLSAIKAQLAAPSPALPRISDEAFRMSVVAKTLGSLALAKDSGIARDQVKSINLAGKNIASKADALHDLADAGKLETLRASLHTLEAAMASLGAPQRTDAPPATAAGSVYFCPMHCEGDKTYAAAGVCSICNMKFKLRGTAAYSVSVTPTDGPIIAGKPVNLRFDIQDPQGARVTDLAIVHEMPLHLLMVSSDLSWYAHEHPTLDSDATFTMAFTFPAPGTYTLFHDFTPASTGMQVVPVDLVVAGTTSAPPAAPVPLKPDADAPKHIDAYDIKLTTPEKIVTGSPQPLTYTLSKGSTPVTNVVPYLGAMGHLVIIRADRKQFVHSHPHEPGHTHDASTAQADGHAHTHDHAPAAANNRGGPTITFDAYFAEPGLYKGWAQFNIASDSAHTHANAAPKLLTVPFTFTVYPAPASAPAADSHTHDHDHDHDHKPDHDHTHP